MQEINRSIAIQRARNYRNAKAGFQQAVYWAAQQALNGNADGLYMIMLNAGMLNGQGGEMTKLADGRQLWSYWNDPQGLNLKGLVDWDKTKTKFKMTAGWRQTVQNLDLEDLHTRLTTSLWSKHEAVKKDPKVFDLDRLLEALIKKSGNNGYTPAYVAGRIAEMTGYVTPRQTADDSKMLDAATAAALMAALEEA